MAEPLERTLRVECPVDHAFVVFTEHVDSWWPRSHRRFDESRLILEPEVGGRFVEVAKDGREARLGEVLLYERPHRIRYTWFPGAINHPTQVDVSFTQDGAETVVRVVHSEGESALGEAWPERVQLFVRGWTHVLAAFESHLVGNAESTGA